MQKDEITKVHMKSVMSQEEINASLSSLSNAARKTAAERTSKDIWAFRPKTIPAPPKPEPIVKVFGEAVGVGEDWSHLSRRRRRAREASVNRDVKWLKQLERVRKAALIESS